MSSTDEWRAFGDERARWPLSDLLAQLAHQGFTGASTVRGIGMEAFSYLIKQLIDRSEDLRKRPLIAITPTMEEAQRRQIVKL